MQWIIENSDEEERREGWTGARVELEKSQGKACLEVMEK